MCPYYYDSRFYPINKSCKNGYNIVSYNEFEKSYGGE